MSEPRSTHVSAHEDGDHNASPTELPLHELAINQLARLRVARGLTQHEVARAMGISQPRVSDTERAALGNAQLDTVRVRMTSPSGPTVLS